MAAGIRARRREPGGPWVALTAAVFYPLTMLLARRRMDGLERVPATGPALLVCNHVSYLDPVYTAVFVHRARRTPRFLAKDSLWRLPVIGRVMPGSKQIPVSRGTAEAGSSVTAAGTAIDEGGVVVIYPEGTVTRDPEGWPMAFRFGAARLALTHDVPVLPVAHWGTREIYDHYRRRFAPSPAKTVALRAGEPLALDDLRARVVDGVPDPALLRETTARMTAAVTDLVRELRGTGPADAA